jgi:hypothetical protein
MDFVFEISFYIRNQFFLNAGTSLILASLHTPVRVTIRVFYQTDYITASKLATLCVFSFLFGDYLF